MEGKVQALESQMGVRNTAKGSKTYLEVLCIRQRENGILKTVKQSKRGKDKREKAI